MPLVGTFHGQYWGPSVTGGAPPPPSVGPTQYPEWQTTTVFMGWPFGGVVGLIIGVQWLRRHWAARR
jgi:hypothetical protein